MPRDLEAQILMAEWLFVETVADVRDRSRDPRTRSRYELLGIAPLLRKLLIDGEKSLADIVGADRPNIPINFRIKPWHAPNQGDDDLPYLLRLGGPELVGGPDDPIVSGIKGFVGTRVGLVAEKDLTVRQVVRYYAHIEGGVHFGEPWEEGQATMNQMAPLLLGHSNGQIELLGHLGQIVVDALTPLCNSILTSPSILRGIHRRNEAGFYDNHWTAAHYSKR